MNENDETLKGKLFLSLARDANRQVRAANQNLSSKIYNMIAINASAITILFGVTFVTEHRWGSSNVFWLIGLALLLVSTVFGVVGYRPLSFQFINPMDLIRELHEADKSYGLTVRKTAGSISSVVELNIEVVNKKAKLFEYMLALMVAGFLFVTAGLAMLLFPT